MTTTFDVPDDIVIIGSAVRTSAATAGHDIGTHWQRFMQDGIAARLPRTSEDLYAVYCDYESDHRGAYTLVLGARVEPSAVVPEGLRRVVVPRGRYARFLAEGEPARALWNTWTRINTEWQERHQRRYAADFERYAPDAFNGGGVRAEVAVGLR